MTAVGYLLGIIGPMDGEAVGRLSVMVAGLIVALFLFYLALSGPAMQLLHRMARRERWLTRSAARAAKRTVTPVHQSSS